MPEMHLRQPELTYYTCGSFTKNRERIQFKKKKKKDSLHIYQDELDKARFQHDMVSGDFKDLTRRTAPDKILRDKAFTIAKNPKYEEYQRWLASLIYKFFDKKNSGSVIKDDNISNKELAEELHKICIKKFKTRKVHSPFTDNIWGADLVDMQLISKFKEGVRFLLSIIDIFSKCTWVIPLKDKRGITITNTVQNIFKKSNRKPNKIWLID